jgi:hypothetical protein
MAVPVLADHTDVSHGSRLDIALGHAEAGIPIIPLIGKKPPKAFTKPAKRATTDPATIKAWFRRWPNANPGTITGRRSGLVLLDLDPRNYTDQSREVLRELRAALPATRVVGTGGGGEHLYFLHPGVMMKGLRDLAPGVQVLGDDHIAVLPGAIHPDTKQRYAITHDYPPAICTPSLVGKVPAGTRWREANRLRTQLFNQGIRDPDAVRSRMLAFHGACVQPPEADHEFTLAELEKIIQRVPRDRKPPGLHDLRRSIEQTLSLNDRRAFRVIFTKFRREYARQKRAGMSVTLASVIVPVSRREVMRAADMSRKGVDAVFERFSEVEVLIRVADSFGSEAATYRLGPRFLKRPPEGTEEKIRTVAVASAGNALSRADHTLFTKRKASKAKKSAAGFGDLPREVYVVLYDIPQTVAEICRRLGRDPKTHRSGVHKALVKLERDGLARRRGDGWSIGAARPADVAEKRGLIRRRAERDAALREECAAWSAWCALPASVRKAIRENHPAWNAVAWWRELGPLRRWWTVAIDVTPPPATPETTVSALHNIETLVVEIIREAA